MNVIEGIAAQILAARLPFFLREFVRFFQVDRRNRKTELGHLLRLEFIQLKLEKSY